MKNVKNQKPSYVHRGGDTALIGATIWSAFETTVATYTQEEALVSLPQGRRFTYGKFHLEATKLAKGLMALNVDRGDRVGIWSTTNIEWVLLQITTAPRGAILVNINPAYPLNTQHGLPSIYLVNLAAHGSFQRRISLLEGSARGEKGVESTPIEDNSGAPPK